MKKQLTLTVITLAAISALSAQAQTSNSGVYLSGSAGISLNGSNEEFYSHDSLLGQAVGLTPTNAIGIDRDMNMAPIIRGAVGYDFGNNIRAEAELSHSKATGALDKATVYDLSTGASASAGPVPPIEDSINRTAFMANAYYDFDLEGNIDPYVMGGIGIANTTAENNFANAMTGMEMRRTTTGLAAQVGVGAAYSLNDTTKLTGEYRFVDYHVGASEGDNGVSSQDHQFTLGLIKHF